MDKLDHIFELQKGFQDKLKRERGLEGIPMETWLQKQLREKGVHAPTQVFLLSVDGRGETICIVKDAVK